MIRAARWIGVFAVATAHAQPAPQPGWEVRVPERVALAIDEAGTLPIAIAVDRGLVVSRDAPITVALVAPGLALKKPRLGRADAVDPEADAPRFAVAIKGAAAGDYAVAIELKLWICGAKTCRPVTARRSVAIAVGR